MKTKISKITTNHIIVKLKNKREYPSFLKTIAELLISDPDFSKEEQTSDSDSSSSIEYVKQIMPPDIWSTTAEDALKADADINKWLDNLTPTVIVDSIEALSFCYLKTAVVTYNILSVIKAETNRDENDWFILEKVFSETLKNVIEQHVPE